MRNEQLIEILCNIKLNIMERVQSVEHMKLKKNSSMYTLHMIANT